MTISKDLFLRDYFAEVEAGNAAVFAGAGLSAPAGFVDWRGLLRDVAAELDLDVDRETDLVSLAQFHVNANGNNRHKINRAIIEALSADNPPTKNHLALAKLPISTWWTTNYDKLIERALKDVGKIVDIKTDVAQLADTRPRRDAIVYKMHGDVDRPNEAVVTRDDYECYPRDRGPFINALAGDLVSKTFLFIGFSFTDPNLDQVFSRIRLSFSNNQRRHFAIFRERKRLAGEADEDYAHARARQVHVINDLKRFNVRVVLVQEYGEIDELLEELGRRYRRQTVFVSASAAEFSPWGEDKVVQFMHRLGATLVERGVRIATGLGLGVGNALFTGAIERVLATRSGHIEDSLLIRPFPQAIADPSKREAIWEHYRQNILSEAGVAIFLFGNKQSGDQIVLANGMQREWEIAHQHNLVTVPVGCTGSMAQELAARALADPDSLLKGLDIQGRQCIAKLAEPTTDLNTLIEPIADLIIRLKRGK